MNSHILAWPIEKSVFRVAWQHSLPELLIWRKQATIAGQGKEQVPLARNYRKNTDNN